MRLPDQAFARIRQCLGLEPSSTAPARRSATDDPSAAASEQESGLSRREPRWRVNVDVPCARHGTIGGVLHTVSLRDLSAVGVCIVSNQQLGAGDRLVVYLPWGPGEYAPIVCTARTVRIRAEGNWRIGAEFVEAGDVVLRQRGRVRSANSLMPSAAADLYFRVAPDPYTAPAAPIPRRHERQPARGEATIYTYEDDGKGGKERRGPLENVQARDVSEGGVSVLRGEPMEPGQRFVVHLSAPGAESMIRLCRVVHVTLSDNRYQIGAKFIPFPNQPPTEATPRKGLSKRLRAWFAHGASPASR
jgi:hypothetical protein